MHKQKREYKYMYEPGFIERLPHKKRDKPMDYDKEIEKSLHPENFEPYPQEGLDNEEEEE